MTTQSYSVLQESSSAAKTDSSSSLNDVEVNKPAPVSVPRRAHNKRTRSRRQGARNRLLDKLRYDLELSLREKDLLFKDLAKSSKHRQWDCQKYYNKYKDACSGKASREEKDRLMQAYLGYGNQAWAHHVDACKMVQRAVGFSSSSAFIDKIKHGIFTDLLSPTS